MEFQHLGALALFAFVSTMTPGPNNIMLMSSGAKVGFVRTIPHMLGVSLGFALMVVLVGAGLMGVLAAMPQSQTLLKCLSLAYLCYLALKIANSDHSKQETEFQPMTFMAAAGFQWVNPKGWSMALTAVTLYSHGHWQEVGIIAGVFLILNLPSVSLWAAAGTQLQRWLTTSRRVKGFNLTMAGSLLLSMLPMV
ncbi:LysE family translocator [Ferrimonas sediminicola]|uniref:LysE family translocator n=1 Tax=Ferrimonas sediminicola TaxID=2569538 RepID=A0A4U1BD61_9GAMM|nr:LysE family translocator [Ferrimonas sediminicola]TKB48973.1 LysE family translocator [Ferrimonas sediminicola]